MKKSKPNESACTEDLPCRSWQTNTQQLGDRKESLREKDGNKSMREHWSSRQYLNEEKPVPRFFRICLPCINWSQVVSIGQPRSQLHSLFPQSISSKIVPKLFLIFQFEVYTPFFEEMGISQRVNLGMDVTEHTEKPNEVYFLKVPLSNLPDRGSLIFTLLSTSAADSFCCYKIS